MTQPVAAMFLCGDTVLVSYLDCVVITTIKVKIRDDLMQRHVDVIMTSIMFTHIEEKKIID